MLTLPQRAAIRSDVRPTGPAPITTTTTRDIRRRTRSNVVLLTRKQQVTATVSATVNSIVAFGTSGSLPQRGIVVIARVTRKDARLATSRREQEIGIFKRNLYHSHAQKICCVDIRPSISRRQPALLTPRDPLRFAPDTLLSFSSDTNHNIPSLSLTPRCIDAESMACQYRPPRYR